MAIFEYERMIRTTQSDIIPLITIESPSLEKRNALMLLTIKGGNIDFIPRSRSDPRPLSLDLVLEILNREFDPKVLNRKFEFLKMPAKFVNREFGPKILNWKIDQKRPPTEPQILDNTFLSISDTGSDSLNGRGKKPLEAKQLICHPQLLTRLSNVSHLGAVEVSRSIRRAEQRVTFVALLSSWDGEATKESQLGRAGRQSDLESGGLRFVPVSLYFISELTRQMSACSNVCDFLVHFLPSNLRKAKLKQIKIEMMKIKTVVISLLPGCNRLRLVQMRLPESLEGCLNVGETELAQVAVTFLPHRHEHELLPQDELVHKHELFLKVDSKTRGEDSIDDTSEEVKARPTQYRSPRLVEPDQRDVKPRLGVVNWRERRSKVILRRNDKSDVIIPAKVAPMLHSKRITVKINSIAVTLRQSESFETNARVTKVLTLKRRVKAESHPLTNALKTVGGSCKAVSLRRSEGFTIAKAAEVLTLKRRDPANAHSCRDGGETNAGTDVDPEAVTPRRGGGFNTANAAEVFTLKRRGCASHNDIGDGREAEVGTHVRLITLKRGIQRTGSGAPRSGEPKGHKVQAVETITISRNLPVHIKWNEAALKLSVARCLPVVVMTITGGVECVHPR